MEEFFQLTLPGERACNKLTPASGDVQEWACSNEFASKYLCCQAAVCTENSIRLDSLTELPIVNDDGLAVMLLAFAVLLSVQVEDPT